MSEIIKMTLKEYFNKPLFLPICLTCFFAFIYSAISLANHFLFRSSALDLGLYTNALYDYAHFHFNDSTMFKSNAENLLSDHFDLMLMMLSPLSWIFGSYTLLITQVLVILLGGWGIYSFLKARQFSPLFCSLGIIIYFLNFSIFSALSFDYHSKVIAASLVPWFFLSAEKNNSQKCIFLFIIIIACQENMSLWMVFVCIAAAYQYRRSEIFKTLLIISLISCAYFLVITKLVMPGLSADNEFHQFKYSILGSNYSEALKSIFTRPGEIIKALFYNTSNNSMGDYVKSECWMFFLFSGGAILIFRPVWLFMLVPIFFQKFLHDQIQMWGVNSQYTIEFAPIIALGIIDFLCIIKNHNVRLTIAVLIVIFTLGTTIRLMDRTSALLPKSSLRIYQSAHWKSLVNRISFESAASKIPADAAISAQANLVPHLAWRDKCYMFPIIRDAGYIFLIKDGNPYPINNSEYTFLSDSLEKEIQHWEKIYSSDSLRLFKKLNN